MAKIENIPNMEKYFFAQVEAEEIQTARDIEAQAKMIAPVDSGNYQNSIRAVGTMVIANAIYSAWLEYGTMKRNGKVIEFSPPHASMRNAAITVSRIKGYRFE